MSSSDWPPPPGRSGAGMTSAADPQGGPADDHVVTPSRRSRTAGIILPVAYLACLVVLALPAPLVNLVIFISCLLCLPLAIYRGWTGLARQIEREARSGRLSTTRALFAHGAGWLWGRLLMALTGLLACALPLVLPLGLLFFMVPWMTAQPPPKPPPWLTALFTLYGVMLVALPTVAIGAPLVLLDRRR